MLTQFDDLIEKHKPVLQSLGILNESGNVDVDKTEAFIKAAFASQPTVRISAMGVNITFDKSDGDALINILKNQAGVSNG